MGQDVADINLVPIVMHGGDQSSFVAADVKDGKFSHLISVREQLARPGKIREAMLPHDPLPMRER
jgi:hypothetical protein